MRTDEIDAGKNHGLDRLIPETRVDYLMMVAALRDSFARLIHKNLASNIDWIDGENGTFEVTIDNGSVYHVGICLHEQWTGEKSDWDTVDIVNTSIGFLSLGSLIERLNKADRVIHFLPFPPIPTETTEVK